MAYDGQLDNLMNDMMPKRVGRSFPIPISVRDSADRWETWPRLRDEAQRAQQAAGIAALVAISVEVSLSVSETAPTIVANIPDQGFTSPSSHALDDSRRRVVSSDSRPKQFVLLKRLQADHLVRNSLYLMLSSAIQAAMGFAFWIIMARLFSTEDVGRASSLISATAVIAYFALFGLNSTLVRFLPTARDKGPLITAGFVLVAGTAAAIGLGYILLTPVFAPRLSFVAHTPALTAGFVLLSAAAAVNLLTDSVFIASRKAGFCALTDGVVGGLSKIVFGIVLVGTGAYGLFCASAGGFAAAALVSVTLIATVYRWRPSLNKPFHTLKPLLKFSSANYIANSLVLLPSVIVPLIVLDRLGAQAAAYYFVAFQMAALLYAGVYAVEQAFLAEGSQAEADWRTIRRRSRSLAILLFVPGGAVLALTAHWVLLAFGSRYSQHGTRSLELLAAAVIPLAVCNWSWTVLRLASRLVALVICCAVYSGAICGFAWILASHGLTTLTAAWPVGCTFAAVIAAVFITTVSRKARHRRTTTYPKPSLASSTLRKPAATGVASRATSHRRSARLTRLRSVNVTNAAHLWTSPTDYQLESQTAFRVRQGPNLQQRQVGDIPVNILISHVYSSNNNGDAAILSAQIGELRRVFPGSDIRVSTIDQVPKNYTFDGADVVQALMYGAVAPGRGKVLKMLSAAVMVPYTALWASSRRSLRLSLPLPAAWRRPMRLLTDADMQVCVGGGYLRAKPDPTSTIILLLLVHQIWLARLLGKPVYLYAQSFGPYPTGLQRLLAKSGLNAASLVLVREAKSESQLADLGIPKARIVKVPDSAFLFTAAPKKAIGRLVRPDGDSGIVVGITVRKWLDEKRQHAYEMAVADLIRHIIAQPRHRVVVIPQVTSSAQHDDDRETGARIAQLLPPDSHVEFLNRRFLPAEILSAYSHLDYLVGTRFHSVIFALLSRVPAVAIEYEHKTSGIMQDLGLDNWVIPIEDVTAERLIRLYDGIVDSGKTYRARLDLVLSAYVAKARTAADLIAKDFVRHAAHGQELPFGSEYDGGTRTTPVGARHQG